MKIKRPEGTKITSIALDLQAYSQVLYLKSISPSFGHSKIYLRGLFETIREATSKGLSIPEDAFLAIINAKQTEIDTLTKEIAELNDLKKKFSRKIPHTLAGKNEKTILVWDNDIEDTRRIPASQYDPACMSLRDES